MRTYQILHWVFLCVGIFTASACGVLGTCHLNDLQFNSAKIVDLHDQKQMVWLGRDPRPHKALLKIEVTSKQDLQGYLKFDFNIFPVVSMCDGGKIEHAKGLQTEYGLYDEFGVLAPGRETNAPSSDRLGLHKYFFYVDLRSVKPADDPNVFLYDLKESPSNICVQLNGGTMLEATFVSNVVKIPSTTVTDAVAELGTRDLLSCDNGNRPQPVGLCR